MVHTVAICDEAGRWITDATRCDEPRRPERDNFKIMSHYGGYDWSGYRTFAGCVAQKMSIKPVGFFIVVEEC